MAIKYFSALSINNSNVEKALKNIPQDAALILNFRNDTSFYEIFKDYELFDAIVGESRAGEINQLQEALLKQPEFTEAISDKNIFISFHPNKADSVDFLYSINLNEHLELTDIEDALIKNPQFTSKKDNKTGIYTITIKSLPRPFFIFFEPGVATGSFSEELLTRSINKNFPKIDENFVAEIDKSSRQNQNSPVNIFINHNKIGDFIGKYIRGKVNGTLGLLTHLKGLSSLNMNFKSDALMFNGISKTDTSSPSYLNLFLNQKPVKNELKRILPDNLAYFISFGISDYTKFESKLHSFQNKRKELSKLQNQLKLVKDRTGVDLDKELLPYLGDEFAVLETSVRENFALIKLKNGREANFTLQLISKALNEEIGQLNHSNIFYYYLGDPLRSYSRPYFSIVDNYLIIANTTGVIESFLDNYRKEKFLINTPDFADYNQYVANQSNVFYFINNKNSERLINTSLKNKYALAFKSEDYGLKNFYGFSYQWSSDDGHFFTNIYVNYKSSGSYKLKEAWKTDLNNGLATQPQLIDFQSTNILLLQDKANTLYAISTEGQKLWSTPITGRIKGTFHKVNEQEVVFNTQDALYKLNISGKIVDGFPIKLPFNASYDLSLFNNKIFLPAGNVIMAYDKDGKQLPNWNHTLSGKILFDLKTAAVGDNHYIIAGTENGNFYFYDEIGDLLTKAEYPSSLFKNPLFTDIADSPENSRIITTDTSGSVLNISYKGVISKRKLTDIHGQHSFGQVNITGNEKPESIFLDKQNLNTISSDGLPIWTYTFTAKAERKLLFFKLNNYLWQCGVVDPISKELFLFNDEGNLVKGFPVKGEGLFLVTSLTNNGSYYLIASKDNTLIAYKL